MSIPFTLNDLIHGFEDLLGARREALLLTRVGPAFEPLLSADLTRARGLPLGLRGAPLADLLEEANIEHDSAARTCKFTLRAQQALPPDHTSAARLTALAQAEAQLLPDLTVVSASYIDSAHAARERADRMPPHRETLAAVPVTAERSLADYFDLLNAAGLRLGTLISERADARTAASRQDARALRSDMVGLLGQLRDAVRAEVARRHDLPPNIAPQIFGFFDELARQRSLPSAPAAEAPLPTPPPDPSPSTP